MRGGGKAPDLYTQNDVSDLGGGGGALTYETDFHAGVSLAEIVGKHNIKTGFDGHRYYTTNTPAAASDLLPPPTRPSTILPITTEAGPNTQP